MKCISCNAEWQVDANRSASITVCPLCNEEILAEKSSDWKYFDNMKDLFEYVAAEYGNDALFGGKYFSDHTATLMPQGQKNLVKQVIDCGAAVCRVSGSFWRGKAPDCVAVSASVGCDQ